MRTNLLKVFVVFIVAMLFVACGNGKKEENPKPALMVIPSDQFLKRSGYLKTRQYNGRTVFERDYANFLLNNSTNKDVVRAIQNYFIDHGYPLHDLEQSLKSLNVQENMDDVDGVVKDAKALLVETVSPDIILEFDYEMKNVKVSRTVSEKRIDYSMAALDAYSNKCVASFVKTDIEGDFRKYLETRLPADMSGFVSQLKKYFQDMVANGRDITSRKETGVKKDDSTADSGDVLTFDGKIKLNIMLPEGLSKNCKNLLENKMMSMTSVNGVGGMDASPIMCVIPTLTEINHDITATIPAKHKIKYDFSVWVANLETGDVYASAQQELLGIGDSEELAVTNVISAINPTDNRWQEMLLKAQERIIDFYNTNGERIINEAKNYLAVNDFSKAMLILNSIPKDYGKVYDEALQVKNVVLKRYFNHNANVLVTKMRACLDSPRDDESGYSKEFLALYAMVPANSTAKEEADELYEQYLSSLDDYARKNLEKQQGEWETQMFQDMMAAELAIQSKQEILAEYKQEQGYKKLDKICKLSGNKK